MREAVYIKSDFVRDPYQTEARLNQIGIEEIYDLLPGLREDAQTTQALKEILLSYFSIPGWYCHAGYTGSVIREANLDVSARKITPEDILTRIHLRLYGSKSSRLTEGEKETIRDLYFDTTDEDDTREYPIRRIAGIFQRSTETIQRVITTTPGEIYDTLDGPGIGEDLNLDPARTRPNTGSQSPVPATKQTTRAPTTV